MKFYISFVELFLLGISVTDFVLSLLYKYDGDLWASRFYGAEGLVVVMFVLVYRRLKDEE